MKKTDTSQLSGKKLDDVLRAMLKTPPPPSVKKRVKKRPRKAKG